MCCSIGAGRADDLSNVDCSVGYVDALQVDDLDAHGAELVDSVGQVGPARSEASL